MCWLACLLTAHDPLRRFQASVCPKQRTVAGCARVAGTLALSWDEGGLLAAPGSALLCIAWSIKGWFLVNVNLSLFDFIWALGYQFRLSCCSSVSSGYLICISLQFHICLLSVLVVSVCPSLCHVFLCSLKKGNMFGICFSCYHVSLTELVCTTSFVKSVSFRKVSNWESRRGSICVAVIIRGTVNKY